MMWRWYRGRIGDNAILCVGLVALLAHISQGHDFPEPLPVAILAAFLLLGRMVDRAPPPPQE